MSRPVFTETVRRDYDLVLRHIARLSVLDRELSANEKQLRALAARPQDAVFHPAEIKQVRALWTAYHTSLKALNDLHGHYLPLPADDEDRLALSFLVAAAAEGTLARHCLRLHDVLGGSDYLQKALDEVPQGAFTRMRVGLSTASRKRDLEALARVAPAAQRTLDLMASKSTWDPNLQQLLESHVRGDTKKHMQRLQTALNAARIDMSAVRANIRADETDQTLQKIATPIATWLGDHQVFRFLGGLAFYVSTFFQNLFGAGLPYSIAAAKNEKLAAMAPGFGTDEDRLIQRGHAEAVLAKMLPGDIAYSRQNWFYSNIGLPGFWKHGLIYVGRPDDLARMRAPDGRRLDTYLAERFPEKWTRFAKSDVRFIEAISEGVEFTSTQHAMQVDYLAVMRPRVSEKDKALAIIRSFEMEGLPYDFGFDFATDQKIVCTEAVARAYAPTDGMEKGLAFKPEMIAGRGTLPANSAVPQALAQSDLIAFLDGRREGHKVVAGNEASLLASTKRGNWTTPLP